MTATIWGQNKCYKQGMVARNRRFEKSLGCCSRRREQFFGRAGEAENATLPPRHCLEARHGAWMIDLNEAYGDASVAW